MSKGKVCSILLSASRKILLVFMVRVTWDLAQMSPSTRLRTSIRSEIKSEWVQYIYFSLSRLPLLPVRWPRYNPRQASCSKNPYEVLIFRSCAICNDVLHCVCWRPWGWIVSSKRRDQTPNYTSSYAGRSQCEHRMTNSDLKLSLRLIWRVRILGWDAVCFRR